MSKMKKATLIIGGVGLAFLMSATPVSAITSSNTSKLLQHKQNNINKDITIKVWKTEDEVRSGKPLFTYRTTFKGQLGQNYITEILKNMKGDILSKKLIRTYGYNEETKDFHFFLADLGGLNIGHNERTPYKIEIKTNKDGTKYQEVSYTTPTTSPHYYYTDKTGKEVSGKTIVSPDDAIYDTYLNKKPVLLTKDSNLVEPTSVLKENQQKTFNLKRGKDFSIYLGYGKDVQIDWEQVRKQLPEGLTVKVTKNGGGSQITGSPKKIGNYTVPITLRLPKKNKVTENTTVKLVFNIQGKKNSWGQDAKGDWFYYKADGTLAKNQWINNTYWVGQDGKMARNSWVDNGKYYVGADGKWVKDAHKPGWHKDAKGDWFYYKADGTPAKNQWIDNTYWVGQDGKMARNAWVDNGKYYVGADGKWVKDAHKPGWHKDAKGDWFYYKADGTPAKNQWIDNTYWVGQDGKMARNAWVDNGKYYVGADGKWIPNHLKRS